MSEKLTGKRKVIVSSMMSSLVNRVSINDIVELIRRFILFDTMGSNTTSVQPIIHLR